MKIVDNSKVEKLVSAYNNNINSVPKMQEALARGGTNEYFSSMTSWQMLQVFALKALVIDNDIDFAKLCYFKCGLLDELLVNKYDEKVLDTGIIHLTYALLSDNQELISRYGKLQYSTYNQSIQAGYGVNTYILQCIIRDDWAEFERAMVIMNAKVVPKFKMELDADFYRAFAEKDKGEMEEVLAKLVSPKVHAARNRQQIVISDFISQPALGYAKLAWLKGIEVEVDSPLVPKELLLVRPLDTYRELDLFTDFK